MTEAERRELEDFYRDVGFSAAEIAEIQRCRRERAVGGESSLFRHLFKWDLHTALTSNLSRVGLMTERVHPRLASLGIRVPAAP
ncbi:MAG: hypothetical protein ACREKF_06245 [Candidatus Methylomirabilales bacterium]